MIHGKILFVKKIIFQLWEEKYTQLHGEVTERYPVILLM